MKGLIALAVLAAVLAACSESEPSTPADQSSLACDHFRNISSDAAAGVLTDAELREKLKEVYDNSIIATTAVRSAAQKMLAAITAGDSDSLRAGITEMNQACTAAGH